MIACSCRKKCASCKCSCYDGNLKCTDACSYKDCDETESFDEDSICDTDEEIDDEI